MNSMESFEPLVRHFYANMEAGKLMGRRCNNCGRHEMFAYPVCQDCGSRDIEWVEFSGLGSVLFLGAPSLGGGFSRYEQYYPGHVGMIRSEEGATFFATIFGVSPDIMMDELFHLCPTPCKIEIREISGNMVPVAVLGK